MTRHPRHLSTGLEIVMLMTVSHACSSSTSLKKIVDGGPTTDAPSLARDLAADAKTVDHADTPPSPDTEVRDKDAPDHADTPADTREKPDTSVVDMPLLGADSHAATDTWPDVAFQDGLTSAVRPCTVDAFGPPCNDNPNSAAVMGECQEDGTCLCKTGYALNPASGRCGYPTPDASAAKDSLAMLACSGEYTACGCACCTDRATSTNCYFPSLGESTSDLRSKDEALRASTNCDLAGCSAGVRYVCCAPTQPEAPGAASYRADSYIGGLDHLSITKSGADCAVVSFAHPMSSSSPTLHIDLPPNWGTVAAQAGACGDAGNGETARGAVGALVLHGLGGDCAADLHVTLFTLTSEGQVKTTRLDVDNLAIAGAGPGMCP
jgi:hypothetical protein